MFPQRCETAEGSLQAGTQKDFETLLLKTGTRGYLYKMEYSEEDVKCIEEEEEEAAAAAVKRQAWPVGKDEDLSRLELE